MKKLILNKIILCSLVITVFITNSIYAFSLSDLPIIGGFFKNETVIDNVSETVNETVSETKREVKENKKETNSNKQNVNIKKLKDNLAKAEQNKDFDEIYNAAYELFKVDPRNQVYGSVKPTELSDDIKEKFKPYLNKGFITLEEYDEVYKLIMKYDIRRDGDYYKENDELFSKDIMSLKQVKDRYKNAKKLDGTKLTPTYSGFIFNDELNSFKLEIHTGEKREYPTNNDFWENFIECTEEKINKKYDRMLRLQVASYITTILNEGDVLSGHQCKMLEASHGFYPEIEDTGEKFDGRTGEEIFNHYEIIATGKLIEYEFPEKKIEKIKITNKKLTYKDSNNLSREEKELIARGYREKFDYQNSLENVINLIYDSPDIIEFRLGFDLEKFYTINKSANKEDIKDQLIAYLLTRDSEYIWSLRLSSDTKLKEKYGEDVDKLDADEFAERIKEDYKERASLSKWRVRFEGVDKEDKCYILLNCDVA